MNWLYRSLNLSLTLSPLKQVFVTPIAASSPALPSAAAAAPVTILSVLAAILWGNEIFADRDVKIADLGATVDVGLESTEGMIQDLERDLERLAMSTNGGGSKYFTPFFAC